MTIIANEALYVKKLESIHEVCCIPANIYFMLDAFAVVYQAP